MKLGDEITFDFTTNNPITGIVQDADVLPICEVFENNIDVPVFIPTAAKRAGKIGNYRVTIEALAANGFKANKPYNVVASATVEGITTKARIAFFELEILTTSSIMY